VISNWTDESRIPPCTIYQAFKYFLDITTPPSPQLLQQFAPLVTNEKQRKRLEVLSKVRKRCMPSHTLVRFSNYHARHLFASILTLSNDLKAIFIHLFHIRQKASRLLSTCVPAFSASNRQ